MKQVSVSSHFPNPAGGPGLHDRGLPGGRRVGVPSRVHVRRAGCPSDTAGSLSSCAVHAPVQSAVAAVMEPATLRIRLDLPKEQMNVQFLASAALGIACRPHSAESTPKTPGAGRPNGAPGRPDGPPRRPDGPPQRYRVPQLPDVSNVTLVRGSKIDPRRHALLGPGLPGDQAAEPPEAAGALPHGARHGPLRQARLRGRIVRAANPRERSVWPLSEQTTSG